MTRTRAWLPAVFPFYLFNLFGSRLRTQLFISLTKLKILFILSKLSDCFLLFNMAFRNKNGAESPYSARMMGIRHRQRHPGASSGAVRDGARRSKRRDSSTAPSASLGMTEQCSMHNSQCTIILCLSCRADGR